MESGLKGHESWLILLGVITIIDLTAPESHTLSEAAHRAMARHPELTALAIIVTAAHLMAGHHRHYSRVDPFKVVSLVRKLTT